MKPTTINVQITKCPRQYEAVRLGMEATIDAGETVEDAIKAATKQLTALYVEMYQPKPNAPQTGGNEPKNEPQEEKQPQPRTKERLTFDDKRLQQIVRRMEKQPEKKAELLKEALKWFEPDEDAMKTLELAVKTI